MLRNVSGSEPEEMNTKKQNVWSLNRNINYIVT
jgi:hypothetical protein